MENMKKILAAVDGSKASMHAARLGLEIAQGMGAELTLIYSVPPVAMPGEVPFTVVNDVVKAEVARGNEIVNEAVRDLGGQLVKGMVVEGPPAERIAELAETDGYDLVVVGSRGRNAVARLFLGSVADRLVHICKKPVLVSR